VPAIRGAFVPASLSLAEASPSGIPYFAFEKGCLTMAAILQQSGEGQNREKEIKQDEA
jgi:hypothetical protein